MYWMIQFLGYYYIRRIYITYLSLGGELLSRLNTFDIQTRRFIEISWGGTTIIFAEFSSKWGGMTIFSPNLAPPRPPLSLRARYHLLDRPIYMGFFPQCNGNAFQ